MDINEFSDENADEKQLQNTSALPINNPSFEQIKLDEAKELYNRKKKMYEMSTCLIQVFTFLLVLIIIVVLLFVGLNHDNLSQVKDLWHIYLISVLSLTTALSGAIYLNRSTWGGKDSEKAPDLARALVDLINKFINSKKQQ